MVNLADAITTLYPEAIPLADFVVADSGVGGPTIERWNAAKLGARPTQVQLDALTDAEVLAGIAAREDVKEPLLADLKATAAGVAAANDVFLALPRPPTPLENAAQVKALTQQQNIVVKALARLATRTWR